MCTGVTSASSCVTMGTISSVPPIHKLLPLSSDSQQSQLDITISASPSPDGKNHVYRIFEL